MINHVGFVDFENVSNIDLRAITGKTKLLIVVGSKQTKKAALYSHEVIDMASSVELVKVKGQGQNALDFFIAYFLGQFIAQDRGIEYSVFSNDKGYDPLIKHLVEEGIRISRKTTDKGSEKPTEHTAGKKNAGIRKAGSTLYERAVKNISETPKKNRPKKLKGLRAHVTTALGNKNTDDEIARIISEFVRNKVISVEGENIKYSG